MNFSEKKELLEKITRLEEEKADLETMLEAVTGHSDGMEEDLLHRVRDMLTASEKRFRVITETIPVPVLVTQISDGVILFANHYAASLFGVPLPSLPGRMAHDFYNLSERQEILRQIREQGILRNREIQGKKADGTPFWAELTVQPFHYNDNSCLLSVWYNITERRTLEKQLRQSQKMEAIGTLTSGIAHDFNNILTAIFGYTERSMGMLAPGSRILHNLEQVFRSAIRAKELVRQLLSFCRQSDEQVSKSFRISLIIEEAMKLLQQIIPPHISVNVSLSAGQSVISGDPTQIHQVMMNLCANAADAIRQTGGRMDILLEEIDSQRVGRLRIPELKSHLSYVRLSVTDNGIGMGKELVERIFDPFFSTKQPGKGTGMGLSVVHGIVKNHGGAISVESEPGKGTAFHVYFPLADVPVASAYEEKKRDTTVRKGRGRILFVDDEEIILEAYGNILESLGYEADTQHISSDALEVFRLNPGHYDLVITDYSMPDMTGIMLAEELIRIRPDIPIILYTGYYDPALREKARLAGIKDFLSKPFTNEELAAILCKFIGSEQGAKKEYE